jgi:transposase InsO family protein
MPWKVSGVVEKRKQFLAEYESGAWTMTDLCRVYGITRPTGYAVLRRYAQDGAAGLEERSRAPQRHPNQTPGEIEGEVLALRRKHPRWGPRTLKKVLETRKPEIDWPAASTMGDMLDREGLTHHRPKRRTVEPYHRPFRTVMEPNDEWAGDFKGWMRTGDGSRVEPLTISDSCSRYLLRCQAVEKNDGMRVQAIFEAAFREYGMPWAIRSDNGPPFASRAIAGLSRLAVWWIKLGIAPQRIQPGHPEQNGRHERMHRTLKETIGSPQQDRRAQQRVLDQFRSEYNEVRPHQALGMQTPAAVYRKSPRQFPARVPEPEYGTAMYVRRVQKHGEFRWKHCNVFLSHVLYGERIGLLPIDDRYYRVYFVNLPIARLDTHKLQVERLWEQDLAADD